MSQKLTGSIRKSQLFVLLLLVLGALALIACPMEEDDPFIDDHKLNTALVGTWKNSGDGWTDTYTITANTDGGKRLGTISHPDWVPPYNNANIAFVYNFSATSGCLIIKYTDGSKEDKYNAVYFKNLSGSSVLLGDAFTVADYTIDPAVATLEEALIRFLPENAETYGGGSKQTGTPQIKQK